MIYLPEHLPPCWKCAGNGIDPDTGTDCLPCRSTGIGITWLAPAQISFAEGCLRKWWYKTVAKAKGEESKSRNFGIEGHAELERYYSGGDIDHTTYPGRTAIRMLEYAPPRSAHLLREWKSAIPMTESWGWYGVMDLVDPGIGYLWDWKFTGNPRKWAIKAEDLKTDVAATIYAWMLCEWFDFPSIGLRWIYGNSSTQGGPPIKVDATITADEARAAVEALKPQAEQLITLRRLAGETTEVRMAQADCVPYNAEECDRYGGCPFSKGVCNVPKTMTLSAALESGTTGEATMALNESVLAKIREQAGNTAGAAAKPAAGGKSAALASQLAALKEAQAAPNGGKTKLQLLKEKAAQIEAEKAAAAAAAKEETEEERLIREIAEAEAEEAAAANAKEANMAEGQDLRALFVSIRDALTAYLGE